MKAIFKKELRDLLPWIAVATILIAALCWYCKKEESLGVASLLSIGFAVVAMAFGFLQTLGDTRTEAKGYLLHRPVSVQSIFWGKLLAGAVGYLAALVLPLMGMAIYQAVMGPERLPTSPAKLIPTVLMSIVMFVLHPAAMWAVSRQARWVGTKTVPLAVAVLGCYVTFSFLTGYSTRAYTSLYWAGFALTALATLVTVTAAASSAFCESQFSPPPGSGRRFVRLDNLGILAACVPVVAFVAISFFTFLVPDANYPYTNHDLAMSSDGQLWHVAQTTLSQDDYWNPEVSVAKVSDDQEGQPSDLRSLPADWTERAKASLSTGDYCQVWEEEFVYLRQFQFSSRSYWDVHEHENRLLAYNRGLKAVLTPTGFYDSLDNAQGAFEKPAFVQNGGRFTDRKKQNDSVGIDVSLIHDRNGVYQVDWKGRAIRKILDQPNEAVALVLPTSDQEPVFWVLNGSSVARYLIEPLNDGDKLELADSEIIKRARTLSFPDIKTTKTDQWSFAPHSDGKSLLAMTDQGVTVAETSDGKTFFYSGSTYPTQLAKYELRAKDGSIDRSGQVTFPPRSEAGMAFVALFLPPALSVGSSVAMMMIGQTEGVMVMAAFAVIHGLLVAAVVFWLSRYYELTVISRNLWLLAALTLGLAAPLAMWIIYPKLVRERCNHCEAMRRIDRARCQQCGSDWARQPADGNEIIGTAAAGQLSAGVS